MTEGRNVAHNQLDLTEEELKAFRDRFKLPLTDKQLKAIWILITQKKIVAVMRYMMAGREELGGYLPAARLSRHH